MFRDPPAIFSPPARMILPPHVFGCYTRVALFESLKIVLAGIAAAVFYGVIHDQFTARICLEYFTVFHPPIFDTQSPTLLALGWGTIATWWAGAILGFLFALAARVGSRPKLYARSLVRPTSGSTNRNRLSAVLGKTDTTIAAFFYDSPWPDNLLNRFTSCATVIAVL